MSVEKSSISVSASSTAFMPLVQSRLSQNMQFTWVTHLFLKLALDVDMVVLLKWTVSRSLSLPSVCQPKTANPAEQRGSGTTTFASSLISVQIHNNNKLFDVNFTSIDDIQCLLGLALSWRYNGRRLACCINRRTNPSFRGTVCITKTPRSCRLIQ